MIIKDGWGEIGFVIFVISVNSHLLNLEKKNALNSLERLYRVTKQPGVFFQLT